MKRPETFNDVKGHDWLVNYLVDNITKGTLHHFLILEGPEGLGKTSIADLIALSLVYGLNPSDKRDDAYKNVICKNLSNDNIKRFKCSVDGGKDVARQIKDEMNTTFTVQGPKVIICDECHGFTEQAQDVFLSETEFMDSNVYLIMLTTEISKLKSSLRSRAVPIHLSPVKRSSMIQILNSEVSARNLNLQNKDIILGMIADWAECKPRAGLNILNAFANNSSVSANDIRELIGYLDVKDVVPLLASLSGSLTYGLSYITEMQIDNTLVDIVIECLNVKSGQASYKMKMDEMQYAREQLLGVSEEQLIKFLAGITRQPKVTRQCVINAFISAHNNGDILFEKDTTESLHTENVQRANVQLEIENAGIAKAPTIDDLLLESKIIN